MSIARDLLVKLRDAAKSQNFVAAAQQLRRAMQAWDVSYVPKDFLTNEDKVIIERLWGELYSLTDMERREKALWLFALLVAAKEEWTFTPLVVKANQECERIYIACVKRLAALDSHEKVVPLRKGGPALVLINNPAPTTK